MESWVHCCIRAARHTGYLLCHRPPRSSLLVEPLFLLPRIRVFFTAAATLLVTIRALVSPLLLLALLVGLLLIRATRLARLLLARLILLLLLRILGILWLVRHKFILPMS